MLRSVSKCDVVTSSKMTELIFYAPVRLHAQEACIDRPVSSVLLSVTADARVCEKFSSFFALLQVMLDMPANGDLSIRHQITPCFGTVSRHDLDQG